MDTEVLSSGIRYTNLPEGYVRPESEIPNLSEVSECENVPVIDLACDDRRLIVQQVAYACKNYGFFQVRNHEGPLEAVERVLEVAQVFFNLPVEEKLKLYSDDPSKSMRLSTIFYVNKEKVHNLSLHCDPLHYYFPEWPSDPPTFKTINDLMHYCLPDHTLDIPESGWGSVTIRGFDEMTITSKLKPYWSQVLLDPSGGEKSSPSGGEDHVIEGLYQGNDSPATAGSFELASSIEQYTICFRSERKGLRST